MPTFGGVFHYSSIEPADTDDYCLAFFEVKLLSTGANYEYAILNPEYGIVSFFESETLVKKIRLNP
jgi:hypothetical protein